MLYYIVSQGGGRLLANMVMVKGTVSRECYIILYLKGEEGYLLLVMVKGTVSRECYGVLSYEALLSA